MCHSPWGLGRERESSFLVLSLKVAWHGLAWLPFLASLSFPVPKWPEQSLLWWPARSLQVFFSPLVFLDSYHLDHTLLMDPFWSWPWTSLSFSPLLKITPILFIHEDIPRFFRAVKVSLYFGSVSVIKQMFTGWNVASPSNTPSWALVYPCIFFYTRHCSSFSAFPLVRIASISAETSWHLAYVPIFWPLEKSKWWVPVPNPI